MAAINVINSSNLTNAKEGKFATYNKRDFKLHINNYIMKSRRHQKIIIMKICEIRCTNLD